MLKYLKQLIVEFYMIISTNNKCTTTTIDDIMLVETKFLIVKLARLLINRFRKD